MHPSALLNSCPQRPFLRPQFGRLTVAASAALMVILAGCSAGGSATGDSPFPSPDSGGGGGGSTATPTTAQACAPTNPYQDDSTSVTTTGSLDIEKAWLKSYMTGAYLWYSEMPKSVDPKLATYSNTADVYGSVDAYFQALKTPQHTSSGKLRDEFSFTYPTKAWQDLSQSGTVQGYGVNWYMASATPPRGIVVATVEPGSVAALAGVLRGDVLISADGVSSDAGDSAGVNVLNAAVYPTTGGSNHTFVFERAGARFSRTLLAGAVVTDPVPLTTVVSSSGGRRVGYIVFNDHIAPAEDKLISAIATLKAAAVEDLVLDLRYNGGGYLFIASELAYMIAGPTITNGKTFERLQYNDKRQAETNSEDANTPFYNESCILDSSFNCTRVADLPTLGLSRVTVLASSGTCSASEAVVNGLRGVNVDVRLIGETTCGKPYGFTAKDNCGISYFPIEFKGVNAKGFGDYADGFAPTCSAADDFGHALGDPAEGRLALALHNLDANNCSLSSAAARKHVLTAQAGRGPLIAGGRPLRGPERETQVLRPSPKR